MSLLLLDNYDSFTYNVYQLLSELGVDVEVIRNDQTTVPEVEAKHYEGIVISPGPGVPKDAGISEDLIRTLGGKVPILGICLGHQVIGEVFGGNVVRAPQPVHGKTTEVVHQGDGLYTDLPQPFTAGRYHSLIVEESSLPECLEVTARNEENLIMGLRHRQFNVQGVQFHPESILTPVGDKLLANFLSSIEAA